MSEEVEETDVVGPKMDICDWNVVCSWMQLRKLESGAGNDLRDWVGFGRR